MAYYLAPAISFPHHPFDHLPQLFSQYYHSGGASFRLVPFLDQQGRIFEIPALDYSTSSPTPVFTTLQEQLINISSHRNNQVPEDAFLEEQTAILDGLSADHHHHHHHHWRRRRRTRSHVSTRTTTAVQEWLINYGRDNNSNHVSGALMEEQTILLHLRTRYFVKEADDDNKEEGPEICVVCQDEYQENDGVGRLSCGHEYHVDCITEWLLQKNVCPVCKAEAFPIH